MMGSKSNESALIVVHGILWWLLLMMGSESNESALIVVHGISRMVGSSGSSELMMMSSCISAWLSGDNRCMLVTLIGVRVGITVMVFELDDIARVVIGEWSSSDSELGV